MLRSGLHYLAVVINKSVQIHTVLYKAVHFTNIYKPGQMIVAIVCVCNSLSCYL